MNSRPSAHAAMPIGVRSPMVGVVYPPASRLREYVASGALGHDTLHGAFAVSAARHGARKALVGPEGDITYTELDETTDRLGGALLALGLQPLDRVIFQIANCNELIIGWLACLKAGLIPICTLAAHREQEIGYLGNHARARLHFVQGDDAKFDDVAFATRMRATIPSVEWILQARGPRRGAAHSLRELIDKTDLATARAHLARVPHDPFQVAVFQLSGGTTGVPKIIPRFHNDYVAMMRGVARVNGYRPDDTLFMPLPMMHNLNMGCCFGPFLLTGGAITVAPALTPEVFLQIFDRYDPTIAILGGPIIARLEPAIKAGKLPLRKLRVVFSPNSAPALRALLNVPVYQFFGTTEGVLMFVRPGDPQIVVDTMVGHPVLLQDEVKLFQIGTEIEVNEADVDGECAFRGPYTISGYYDAAERNKEAFTSEGFYRSGDLMRFRDVDGQRHYEFRGRTKDVVDRGGEKINCEELENAVNRHPALAGCAVVGMPDPVMGERACAFVIARRGMTAPTVAELGAFLQEFGLAKFKWPERIEIVDDFPVTTSGKLSKPKLRALIAERLAAERAATVKGKS
jgi:2,3-dihydroxybenzoate-AMP ligase